MRPLLSLLIYFVGVFIGGALLAPWLFKAAQVFAPKLAEEEFHTFVQNSLLIVALAGAWPLVRMLGMTHLRDIGLVNPIRERRRFGVGFLLGFISLAIVVALTLALGVRQFRHHEAGVHLISRFSGIILTALGVAVLEEILFRGAIFGALRKVFHWGFALVVTSAVYAIMHFLAAGHHTGAVTWLSGLQLLPQMLGGFLDIHDLVPAFFNLTLAGILLGLAYQRTGNLWFSIGIHAGWIFWVKAYAMFTNSAKNDAVWFYGTNRMVNGWLAFLVLAASVIVFALMFPARKQCQINT